MSNISLYPISPVGNSGEIPIFVQRIVSVEPYMSDPIRNFDTFYSTFRAAEVRKVPIIRIFGSTPKGQKTCTHIHGVFPYIYVLNDRSIKDLERQLPQALDQALTESFTSNYNSNNNYNKRPPPQCVYKISKVTGKSFYGYHSKDETFLKIYFYNYKVVQRAADFLQRGKVLGRGFQTFESHIPYILQFFMDYGLYGMNFVSYSSVKFRRIFNLDATIISSQSPSSSTSPLQNLKATSDPLERVWNIDKLNESFFNSLFLEKTSHCELEIDVNAANIIVQRYNSIERLPNPGIDHIWEDERERRRQNEIASQITIPLSQDRDFFEENMFPTEERFMKKLKETLFSVNPPEELVKPFIQEERFPCASQIQHINPSLESEISALEGSLLGSDDDEDVLKLFEDLAREKELADKNLNELPPSPQKQENLFDSIEDVEEEEEEDGEDENNVENIWETSFLSKTLEDLLEKTEEDYKNEQLRSDRGSPVSNLNENDFKNLINDSFEFDPSPPQHANSVQNSEKIINEKEEVTAEDKKEKEEDWDFSPSPTSHSSGEFIPSSSKKENSTMIDIIEDKLNSSSGVAQVAEDLNCLDQIDTNLIIEEEEEEENKSEDKLDSQELIKIISKECKLDDEKMEISENKKENEEANPENLLLKSMFGDNIPESIVRLPPNVLGIETFFDYSSQISKKTEENIQWQKEEGFYISSQENTDKDNSSPSPSPKHSSNIKKKKMVRNKSRKKLKFISEKKAVNLFGKRVGVIWSPLKKHPTYTEVLKWLENKLENNQNSQISENTEESEVFLLKKRENEFEKVKDIKFKGTNISDDSNSDDDDTTFNDSQSPNQSQDSPRISPKSSGEISLKSALKITPNRSKGENWKKKAIDKRRLSFQDEPIIIDYESDSPPPPNISPSPSSSKKLKLQDNLRKNILLKSSSITPPVSPKSPSQGFECSEIDGPQMDNSFGFKHNVSNLQNVKAVHECQYLTTMSVEVLCESRKDLNPNPEFDAVLGIFIYISNDVPPDSHLPQKYYVTLLQNIENIYQARIHFGDSSKSPQYNSEFHCDEHSLFLGFIDVVRKWDPCIFVGYEVHRSSIGYLIERSRYINIELVPELSRLIKINEKNPFYQNQNQHQSTSAQPEPWNEIINGRIIINLWNILRHEIAVNSYSFENVVFHILHERYHHFSYELLFEYWKDPLNREKVLKYYKRRAIGVIEIMEKLDLVNRTSELARLFGIQFIEVFSRGSQFRVESMMLRLARPENLIPVSPNVQQRAKMKAPEFIPLILEPISNFYTDPVAVLDFQSLYPSMIIAYNYDYSTCLGRVEYLGNTDCFEFGCLNMEMELKELKSLEDYIHISPAGVAFVKKEIKRGILPQMLEQILESRLMVKRAMKRWKGEEYKTLQKVLDSRQLGLKLIANVTYGYTAANYSGRMPCVEIADSVVSKGRETLQRAIDLVEKRKKEWGGDVVYGDTDSLFVHFPGKSREKAFKIAQKIVDEVTRLNPKPVKLKLEKIYQPCILQSKKRYVGYAFESPNQIIPKYDAKGIETVRRDGCPIIRKILEVTIRTLFDTRSEATVKKYIDFQFQKLFLGRVSLCDYTFARAYRGRSGYKPNACVPSLDIAKKLLEKDPRGEPLTKERVPYVIVYGHPNLPLIQLVRTPKDFLNNPSLRLNAHYYIEKAVIPAINRCLSLAKMNVSKWYSELPRKYMRANLYDGMSKKGTIADYFISEKCELCPERVFIKGRVLCDKCHSDISTSAMKAILKIENCEKRYLSATRICSNCSSDSLCTNFDCDIFHKLNRYKRDFNEIYHVRRILNEW